MKLPKAGMYTVIMMFWFVGVAFLYYWGLNTGSTQYTTPFMTLTSSVACIPAYNSTGEYANCTSPSSTSGIAGSNMFSALAIAVGGSAIAGAVVGLIFPNPYSIFAGVALTFMSILTLPVNLLNDDAIPFPIRFSLLALYGFGLFGLIGWFRGGDSP